jgi:hypothetical protein
MNPNDYDDDGNNIVPCPICLSQYCPSKYGGKCQDEEDFIKSTTNMNNKQWEEEFKNLIESYSRSIPNFGVQLALEVVFLTDVKNFIQSLLNKREAEIRKETILAVLPEREIYRFIRDRERSEEIEYKNQIRQSIIDKAKEKFNIIL